MKLSQPRAARKVRKRVQSHSAAQNELAFRAKRVPVLKKPRHPFFTRSHASVNKTAIGIFQSTDGAERSKRIASRLQSVVNGEASGGRLGKNRAQRAKIESPILHKPNHQPVDAERGKLACKTLQALQLVEIINRKIRALAQHDAGADGDAPQDGLNHFKRRRDAPLIQADCDFQPGRSALVRCNRVLDRATDDLEFQTLRLTQRVASNLSMPIAGFKQDSPDMGKVSREMARSVLPRPALQTRVSVVNSYSNCFLKSTSCCFKSATSFWSLATSFSKRSIRSPSPERVVVAIPDSGLDSHASTLPASRCA